MIQQSHPTCFLFWSSFRPLKVKSLSHVRFFATPWTDLPYFDFHVPTSRYLSYSQKAIPFPASDYFPKSTFWWYCSLSGSSVHGIFQARVLEWVKDYPIQKTIRLRMLSIKTDIICRFAEHWTFELSWASWNVCVIKGSFKIWDFSFLFCLSWYYICPID